MAKRFQFDDEDNDNQELENYSHIDELEDMKNEPLSYQDETNDEYDDEEYEENEDESFMSKVKKMKWKWWHYAIVVCVLLFIVLMVYVYVLSNNDGPVYGKRCEGITTTIPQNTLDTTSQEIKKTYSEVQNISFEVVCKQLKVDILFKDKMDTKKAEKIAEETVQMIDKAVGKDKEKGKTYSRLFGYDNNVGQYEVNLFLESAQSDDFPIYATKHVSKDEFAYTLQSIKDKDSFEKAKSTLKD